MPCVAWREGGVTRISPVFQDLACRGQSQVGGEVSKEFSGGGGGRVEEALCLITNVCDGPRKGERWYMS